MWPVTLCFIFVIAVGISRAQSSNTPVSRDVADATDSFSVDFFKAVLEDNRGNVVTSPVSLSTALSIVQQGSCGNTEAQLTEVLYLTTQQSRQGYSNLTRNLKESSGNETLEFANGAFLGEGFQINPAFRKVVTEEFLSTVQTVQFGDPPAAADEINSWVAGHTHDKIQDLVSPGQFDSLTRLVLVNAIYYKNYWKVSFDKKDTRNEVFFIDGKTTKKVPTMHLTTKLLTGYSENLKSQWLQLPFEGDRFYLLIILPDDYEGVDNVTNSLTGSEISDIIYNINRSGNSREVELSLPKFKLDTTLALVRTLEKMGLTDIFDGRANLCEISEERLYVSQVVQKAQIEVDEEGATAAAATVIIGTRLTAVIQPPSPLVFRVDHPFIVIIMDAFNKLPLFVSRVADPTAS